MFGSYSADACGGSVSGTTVGGTTTALGSCVTDLSTGPGKWHTFTSATSQVVTLTTCNATGFDTKLGVFSGTCGNNIACADATTMQLESVSPALRSTATFTATGRCNLPDLCNEVLALLQRLCIVCNGVPTSWMAG